LPMESYLRVNTVLEPEEVSIPLVVAQEVDLGLVEKAALVERMEVVLSESVEVRGVPWRKPSRECQGMTILSLLKFQRHPSFVMARLMEATMRIQKLNARLSTFVPMMEMVV